MASLRCFVTWSQKQFHQKCIYRTSPVTQTKLSLQINTRKERSLIWPGLFSALNNFDINIAWRCPHCSFNTQLNPGVKPCFYPTHTSLRPQFPGLSKLTLGFPQIKGSPSLLMLPRAMPWCAEPHWGCKGPVAGFYSALPTCCWHQEEAIPTFWGRFSFF